MVRTVLIQKSVKCRDANKPISKHFFLQLSLALPLIALASAASAAPMQAALLPPGVDPAACPNYPYCSDLNPIIPQNAPGRQIPFGRQQPTAVVGQVTCRGVLHHGPNKLVKKFTRTSF